MLFKLKLFLFKIFEKINEINLTLDKIYMIKFESLVLVLKRTGRE